RRPPLAATACPSSVTGISKPPTPVHPPSPVSPSRRRLSSLPDFSAMESQHRRQKNSNAVVVVVSGLSKPSSPIFSPSRRRRRQLR
ncbi:hypothetical protein LINPERPRIM_LOCUS35073, partial [Linum perenne]